MKKHTAKREGLGLEFRAFKGKSGKSYMVFRTTKGSYHAFAEVNAKDAAIDCGSPKGNTRAQWKAVWDAYHQVRRQEPVIPKDASVLTSSALERLRARIAASKR